MLRSHCNCVCVMLGAAANENVLFRLREPLKEMIDPEFLFLAELASCAVLSDEERQSVKSKDAYQKKNDMLLTFVVQKDDATLVVAQFIKCLQSTNQDHVCNFICYNGGKQTFYLVCFVSVVDCI